MLIPQAETLFDIRVIDTNTQSYQDGTPLAVKQKYSQTCRDRKATFTPLCVSADDMSGCEATDFLKLVGDILSAT